MLLERLVDYAGRLGGTGPPMYGLPRIKYVVALDEEGGHPTIVTLSGGEGGVRDRGLEMFAPNLVRSVAIKPKLLADNAEYALGWSREGGDAAKVAARHAAFVDLARDCAAATGNRDVATVVRFLEGPDLAELARPEDFGPTANVTFEVAGRRPIDAPDIQGYWARKMGPDEAAAGADLAECLVCGRLAPPVERLQFKIKGIPGGQTSGTALISANAPAFESYGLEASRVAPICDSCAERFSKGLNDLLSREANHRRLGGVVYVFWTREEHPFSVIGAFDDPQPERVNALIASFARGDGALVDFDPTPFYAVALAGSGGRVAIRDWIDTTIGQVQRNFARYFQLQRIVTRDGAAPRYAPLWALIRAAQRTGSKEDAPIAIPRALLRLALAGGPLPTWLLATVLRRVAAEQGVSPTQAMLIKMVLASQRAPGHEEDLMELDRGEQSPAYLCGRLLAVLDAVQYAALGPRNATVIDRFFGTASTAPGSVFPRLVRGAEPHLAKLRRNPRRYGAYVALDRRLCEVLERLDAFPRTLTVPEQGLFVLGFYHQRAADSKQRLERALEADGAEGEEAEPDEQ